MVFILRKIDWKYLTALFAGIAVGAYLMWLFLGNQAQAKLITFNSRGISYQIVSSADSVGGALAEQNLDLESLMVDPPIDSPLRHGMRISYAMPAEVQLVDGLTESKTVSVAKTVSGFLAEQNITLNSLDEVEPSLDQVIFRGMEIVIKRVEEGEIVEREPVGFEVLYQGDNNMLYGKEVVAQEGLSGEQEVTYKVRYKNGEEISKIKLSSTITKNPVSKIIRAGRKIEVESYEKGRASWYAYEKCLCAAHPFFPKGSYLRVTALASGKTVVVRVNDWGPDQSVHPDRVIDLDAEAFKLLAPLGAGTIQVKVEKLKSE